MEIAYKYVDVFRYVGPALVHSLSVNLPALFVLDPGRGRVMESYQTANCQSDIYRNMLPTAYLKG